MVVERHLQRPAPLVEDREISKKARELAVDRERMHARDPRELLEKVDEAAEDLQLHQRLPARCPLRLDGQASRGHLGQDEPVLGLEPVRDRLAEGLERRGRPDLRHGRNEVLRQDGEVLPLARALHDGERQALVAVPVLVPEEEAPVHEACLDGLAVRPGVLVRHLEDLGGQAAVLASPVVAGKECVRRVLAEHRNTEKDVHPPPRLLELGLERAREEPEVRAGGEDGSVLQLRLDVTQLEDEVLHLIRRDVHPRDAPEEGLNAAHLVMERFLPESLRCLQVVRPEEHPLGPEDRPVLLHGWTIENSRSRTWTRIVRPFH